MPTRIERRSWRLAALLLLAVIGCGGPSDREIKNARAFEALLSAISLKNPRELEADALLIEQRHNSGDLSDGHYRPIAEIIARARSQDWAEAEKQAYEFRHQFGDDGAYFR